MSNPHVRVYLDDEPNPVIDHELPTQLELDTRQLTDGPHRIVVRAEDRNGIEGFEEIAFHVQNGPGIMVTGLRPGSTQSGKVHLKVDAFSASDPFDPRRAEARSAIPTWVWVLFLFVVAWIIFYVATEWAIPADMRSTPTYGTPAATTPATPPAG
ncbi:MAG: cytochrome C [Rhodanobacter sp.]|nr:MAG: cytochrome C [Rhodanobacter sp.]TAM14577.1 MAG: cytochrome C [Rhodanobacter sp.]TAM37369.1 MAG: cytochrome C [Rhodanobacter sp.]